MDIHLDPLGGWSGDMFVAALLDAFPEHLAAVEAAVAALDLGPGAAVRLVAHRDAAGLTGRRFLVAAEGHGQDGHEQRITATATTGTSTMTTAGTTSTATTTTTGRTPTGTAPGRRSAR